MQQFLSSHLCRRPSAPLSPPNFRLLSDILIGRVLAPTTVNRGRQVLSEGKRAHLGSTSPIGGVSLQRSPKRLWTQLGHPKPLRTTGTTSAQTLSQHFSAEGAEAEPEPSGECYSRSPCLAQRGAPVAALGRRNAAISVPQAGTGSTKPFPEQNCFSSASHPYAKRC